jgi:hypothetical protein
MLTYTIYVQLHSTDWTVTDGPTETIRRGEATSEDNDSDSNSITAESTRRNPECSYNRKHSHERQLCVIIFKGWLQSGDRLNFVSSLDFKFFTFLVIIENTN